MRIREVRVIGPEGEQLGILPTVEAFNKAQEGGYDLVEVAPTSQPPVCRISFNGFAAVASVVALIAVMVAVALAFDALLWLIGGVIVLCVTVVALARVGVSLFSRWADAKVKIDTARYDFLQNMASKGVLPASGEYLWRSQLEAPAAPQKQLASPGSQIILNPNALRESAVNLLLFSCRLLGDNSNRIASGPECAEAGVTGYTGRTWSMVVNDYLKPKYEVVTVTGPISNGGGTYVPESIGTVKRSYMTW